MSIEAQAIVHTAAKQVTLHSVAIPSLKDDQVLIRTVYSAISPGTEGMIFNGNFPENNIQDTTIKSLSDDFSYPFRYGYCLVGEIIETGKRVDKKWLNKNVFAFHPHQSYALVEFEDCLPIPEHIPLLQALFLPNMETAVNFAMDAAPLIGEKVWIIGQGIVGLLTTALLSRFPLSLLISSDPLAYRREFSKQMGAMQSIDPNDNQNWLTQNEVLDKNLKTGFDLVLELSGNSEALNQAIEMTGFSGRILIGSWYGNKENKLNLSGRFHRNRIHFLSSQVSTLSPELSGRWDKSRRIELVWDYLDKINLQNFITHRFSLQQCQQAFQTTLNQKEHAIQVIFNY